MKHDAKMLPIPYVASLRVYEPIDSFDLTDQLRWSQISITSETRRDEQVRTLIRTIKSDPPNLIHDRAHFLEFDGEVYVSPWSTKIRCWEALENFKYSMPATIVKFFIPQFIEESISKTSNIMANNFSHVLTSTWNIPPRWFALFSPDERIRGVNNDGPFTILRTSIANSKIRCAFAHQAVLRAFGEGSVEGEVAQLLAWLESFNIESIVELDYGGLATYLNRQLIEIGEGGLEADTSIEDVATSIHGLASGDGVLASRGYERLISRWRKVAAFESAT